MTSQLGHLPPGSVANVRLPAVQAYLRNSGWSLRDEDARTSLWRPQGDADSRVQVVLPAQEDFSDYTERLVEAVRAVSFVERRAPHEVLEDIEYGGADTVSVRLTPAAPPGEAPLGMAHAAIAALRNLVVGSAAGIDGSGLVLPPRRPPRAEAYASQARLSTASGSFVLNLALPLVEETQTSEPEPPALVDVPSQPYGRRVANRMRDVTLAAQALARRVADGDEHLRAFATPGTGAPNATELAALAALGGDGSQRERYHVRFAQSPLSRTGSLPRPLVLPVTPAEQRIMDEASEYLRTKQPRSGVTVTGLVVRLARVGNLGSGDIVVLGIDDDSGTQRRFRLNLSESDYDKAFRAHGEGLQVSAIGDVDVRGNQRYLQKLASFDVVPGLDYAD